MSTVLQDVFVEDLSELYAVEEEQLQMLPKLAEAAADQKLKQAFEQHLEMTRRQQERLTRIFEMLGEEPTMELPEGAEGLATDALEKMGRDADNEIVDVMLLGAARKVEHMEMAGYESAHAMAQALELNEAAKLLEQTLREEEQTDRNLAQIAKPLLKIAAQLEDDLEAEEIDDEIE